MTLMDSAGNTRTEDEVTKMARDTLDHMSKTEIIEMLVKAVGSVQAMPPEMTKCPCHGLWYDKCEAYT